MMFRSPMKDSNGFALQILQSTGCCLETNYFLCVCRSCEQISELEGLYTAEPTYLLFLSDTSHGYLVAFRNAGSPRSLQHPSDDDAFLK